MRGTGLGRAPFLLLALLSATLEFGCGSVSAVGDGSAGADGAAGTGTGRGGMDAGASGAGGTSARGGTSGTAGVGGTAGIDAGMDARTDGTDRALSCTTIFTAANCTPGAIPEINLGQITATACHDQCQTKLTEKGLTSGCWILAVDLNCYCRGGVLNTGGDSPGGACNQS